MSILPGKLVNIVPYTKIKNEVILLDDNDEDMVYCRICSKGFAHTNALSNHVRIQHIEAYSTGDPKVWTDEQPVQQKLIQNSKMKIDKDELKIKTEEFILSLESTSMTSLASNDVKYVIIKDNEGIPKKKKRERIYKPDKEINKKTDSSQCFGPFECLEKSITSSDDLCHQIFFSCCEYSLHYRDEHTRRRKGNKCQVCEKPLVGMGSGVASPFNCDICGEGFQTAQELSVHHTDTHVKLKPYKCTICLKRFTQKGGLIQHMRMHTGDRPFSCIYCSKSFTQKAGLDQHLRIHTKVKPYRCVVCEKTFCQSVHLKQHMRNHTNVTPFQCGICEKKFKQGSHLNYHLRNHNPDKMTDEQREKYSQIIDKEYVEIEIDQNGTLVVDSIEEDMTEELDVKECFEQVLVEESWAIPNC